MAYPWSQSSSSIIHADISSKSLAYPWSQSHLGFCRYIARNHWLIPDPTSPYLYSARDAYRRSHWPILWSLTLCILYSADTPAAKSLAYPSITNPLQSIFCRYHRRSHWPIPDVQSHLIFCRYIGEIIGLSQLIPISYAYILPIYPAKVIGTHPWSPIIRIYPSADTIGEDHWPIPDPKSQYLYSADILWTQVTIDPILWSQSRMLPFCTSQYRRELIGLWPWSQSRTLYSSRYIGEVIGLSPDPNLVPYILPIYRTTVIGLSLIPPGSYLIPHCNDTLSAKSDWPIPDPIFCIYILPIYRRSHWPIYLRCFVTHKLLCVPYLIFVSLTNYNTENGICSNNLLCSFDHATWILFRTPQPDLFSPDTS